MKILGCWVIALVITLVVALVVALVVTLVITLVLLRFPIFRFTLCIFLCLLCLFIGSICFINCILECSICLVFFSSSFLSRSFLLIVDVSCLGLIVNCFLISLFFYLGISLCKCLCSSISFSLCLIVSLFFLSSLTFCIFFIFCRTLCRFFSFMLFSLSLYSSNLCIIFFLSLCGFEAKDRASSSVCSLH